MNEKVIGKHYLIYTYTNINSLNEVLSFWVNYNTPSRCKDYLTKTLQTRIGILPSSRMSKYGSRAFQSI